RPPERAHERGAGDGDRVDDPAVLHPVALARHRHVGRHRELPDDPRNGDRRRLRQPAAAKGGRRRMMRPLARRSTRDISPRAELLAYLVLGFSGLVVLFPPYWLLAASFHV